MSFGIFGRARREDMFRRAAQLRLQRISNTFRNVALDREDVGQFTIVRIGPKMRIGQRI